MPVDITEESIRIRVRDPDSFVEGSFRTITISEDEGIKAVIGKLKSDPDGSTVIQSYIFDKDKWTAAEAEKWVSDNKKSACQPERRFLDNADIDMRFDDPQKPKIVGYAAVFNKVVEIWPGFREQVAPGAFAGTIEKDDIRALWNHNPDYVLGRTKSGTLTLSEDDKGLRYEIIPPDTTWARDLQILIKRKDVSQSSFGFNIVDEDIRKENEGKHVLRTIKGVKLFDVSPVTFPAYPNTEVHVRMIAGKKEIAYLFEGSGQVIMQAIEADEPKPEPAISDEELFSRLDVIKAKIYS